MKSADGARETRTRNSAGSDNRCNREAEAGFKRSPRRDSLLTALQVAFVAGVAVVELFFAETLPVEHGLGWDGRVYGAMAKDFNAAVTAGESRYRLQRFVPSMVVHYSLRAARLPLDDEHVVSAFRIYAAVVLVFSSYFWGKIAAHLNLKPRDRWLGLILLLCNYAVLKQFFYSPVSTDQSAFGLSMLMLLCFLKRRVLGLLMVALIGIFTWPTIAPAALLLTLFPRSQLTSPPTQPQPVGWLPLSVCALVAADAAYARYRLHLQPLYGAAPIVDSVLLLSIAIAIAYLFFALRALVGAGLHWSDLRSARSLRCLLVGLIIVAAAEFAFLRSIPFARAEPSTALEPMFANLPHLWVLSGITRPGVFVVAHAVYFGPVIILTFILWKNVTRIIMDHGIGLQLFFFGGVVMSLNAESRQLIIFVPFLVAFVSMAWAQQAQPTLNYLLIAALAVAFSKIWFPINHEAFDGDLLAFPYQRFFMNIGPWMSDRMYLLQGAVVTGSALLLFLLIRRRNSALGLSPGVCE